MIFGIVGVMKIDMIAEKFATHSMVAERGPLKNKEAAN